MQTDNPILQKMLALRSEVDASHARSNREALLEHARMGRDISTVKDGKVVWIPPAEIFARYGFDEFGRPLPTTPAATEAA